MARSARVLFISSPCRFLGISSLLEPSERLLFAFVQGISSCSIFTGLRGRTIGRSNYTDRSLLIVACSLGFDSRKKTCRTPAMALRYGMYDAKQLVGVAILSVSTNNKTLTNAFPNLIPNRESLELGRFCLLDEVPCNGETWLLKRIFHLAYKKGVRGIVSFSDPVGRTNAQGEIIIPGHLGRIYQLKEALYTGRSEARTLILLPDGGILHERTRQKIRAQEKGYEAAERVLHKLGAPARTASETPAQWLHRALPTIGARKLRHQGNYRCLFPLDRRVRKDVRLPILPYPTR